MLTEVSAVVQYLIVLILLRHILQHRLRHLLQIERVLTLCSSFDVAQSLVASSQWHAVRTERSDRFLQPIPETATFSTFHVLAVRLVSRSVLGFGTLPLVLDCFAHRSLIVQLRLFANVLGLVRVQSVLLHAVLELVGETCRSCLILGLVGLYK